MDRWKIRSTTFETSRSERCWEVRAWRFVHYSDYLAIRTRHCQYSFTTSKIEGLSIIVCDRTSWFKEYDIVAPLKEGNETVLQKFIDDFIPAQLGVAVRDLLFWNGREAATPLPWAALNGIQQARQPGLDYENEASDERWCRFFETRPDNSNVIVLIRGIDGASIDPGTWLFLQQRYPKSTITIAFSVSEMFVRMRAPAGSTYFYRTAVYDARLYGFFPLSSITNHVMGTTHDPRVEWLISEWAQGTALRQQISMAWQADDVAAKSTTHARFTALYTNGRNSLPRTLVNWEWTLYIWTAWKLVFNIIMSAMDMVCYMSGKDEELYMKDCI